MRRNAMSLAVTAALSSSLGMPYAWAKTPGDATDASAESPTTASAAAGTTSKSTASASATDVTLPTVSVSGHRVDGYRATRASVAGFAGAGSASLLDTPASVTVVTRSQLDDQHAKLLSDVARNDASVGDDYAPVGFYEDFNIRGFPIDLASSIKINGLTVTGEQNFGLENKEQVEILKGLAGIESGVVSPGGIINFVTKRPINISSVTTEVDSRGGTSASVDMGRRFGDQDQFGIRVNAARENIHSYVDGADGHRTFGSIAADWNLTPRASLQLDAEYQNRIQRSVSGYQLLGGTVVPADASTSKLLGVQPWAKPVTANALNLNGRFDYRFNETWKASIAASRSHSMLDDNVAFAYGCGYSPSCGTGGSSPYFFSKSGDFDVYDYRSPGEYRRNDDEQAELSGRFNTGPVEHQVTVGVDVQRRVVHQADAVYDYVGTENIYGPDVVFSPSSNTAGPSYPTLDSWQYGLFATDKIVFSKHWQLLAGGREVWLRQRSWTEMDTAALRTDRTTFLPDVALVYKPIEPVSLYASYSKALSLGDQAPARADNAYTFLPPQLSRQVEAGAKYDWSDSLSLTAALFSISKPFEYAQPDATGSSYNFVSQGNERHRGIELSASGKLTQRVSLTASLMGIQARASGTGTAAYEGHQVINVPRLRAALYAAYAVPGLSGLSLQGGVDYSGSKTANEEGTTNVPSYFVFNLGARYTTKIGGHKATIRLSVDNLFNKYYWQDSGESQGDAYLFLGAPRTATLSLTYDF